MAFALRFSEVAGREFDALDGAMQERIRIVLKMTVNAADPKAYFKRIVRAILSIIQVIESTNNL